MAENDQEQPSQKTRAEREKAGRKADQPRLFGPADEVEDNRSTAGKALENQIDPDAPGGVLTGVNPGYSHPDDERVGEESQYTGDGNDVGEYVGVSPEYRNYSNDTEKPYAFEDAEGDNVESLADKTDNSVVDPFPVQHSDEPAKKTAAAKR